MVAKTHINFSLEVPGAGLFFWARDNTSGKKKTWPTFSGTPGSQSLSNNFFTPSFIIKDLYDIGPTLILHVCMDTLAAWRIIEKEFPWVVCSTCTLLLKVFLAPLP